MLNLIPFFWRNLKMAKVIVLGGCGAVGSVAVKTLAAQDIFSHVIIGA